MLPLLAAFGAGLVLAPGGDDPTTPGTALASLSPQVHDAGLNASPWTGPVSSLTASNEGLASRVGLQVRGRLPSSRPPEDLSDPWAGAGSGRSQQRCGLLPLAVREVQRLVVSESGRFEVATVRVEDLGAQGPHALVAYDLAGLAPRAVYPLEALRGHQDPDAPQTLSWRVAPIAAAEDWWVQLGQAIVTRVGAANWDPKHHVLAWCDDSSRLLVRHDGRALRDVEAVLDTFATRALQSTPVRAEFLRKGEAPIVLTLDVPWRRDARACRGPATIYLADYDVEVGMGGAFLSDMILDRLENGVGVHALRREDPRGGDDELLLHIACVTTPPRVERRRYQLGGLDPITIEIPQTRTQSWHGHLSARPGTHVIQVSEEIRCRVTVGEERAVHSRLRGWRRVADSEPENAPLFPESRFDVRLTGARTGTIGHGVLVLDGEGDGLVRLRPREVLFPLAAAAAGGPVRDNAIAGGVVLTARALGDYERPLAIDVVVACGRTTDNARRLPADHAPRYADDVRLPSADLDLTTQRILLAPDGSGRLVFPMDMGHGVEECTLEVCALRARR